MTLPVNDRRREYLGDGVATVFNGPNAFTTAQVIAYSQDNGTGVVTLINSANYTVLNLGRNNGTKVTMSVAPASGTTLILLRSVAYLQDTDITNQGAFLPETLEKGYDYLGMQIQQLADGVSRSLRLPEFGAFNVNTVLPIPSPLSPLVWNALGTAIENGSTTLSGDLLLRPNLALNTGSTLVGTKQPDTGAFSRTVADKFQDYLNIMDFANPADRAGILSGSISASAAIQAAVNAAITRGRGGVEAPAGRFLIDTTISVSVSGQVGFAIRGAGMGLTQFIVTAASGNGFVITYPVSGNWWLNVTPSNALLLEKFSLTTTSVNVGTGIKINGNSVATRPLPPTVFNEVDIRGNSQTSHYFAILLHIVDVGDAMFTNCRFYGGGPGTQVATGVKIESSAVGTDPTEIRFLHCEFYFGENAVTAGQRVEGIYFTNCSIVGANRGVVWDGGGLGESGLWWTGGHISTVTWAFDLINIFDMSVTGLVAYSENGIRCNGGGNININGNTFYTGTTAIQFISVTSGSRGSLIEGNLFSTFVNPIVIDVNCTAVMVGNNHYPNCTNRVQNSSVTSTVLPRVYAATITPTLTGGAVSENLDVAIPAGFMFADPLNAVLQGTGNIGEDIIGWYDWGNAATTATNCRFVLKKRDGTALPAGVRRFGFTAFGT